MWKTLFTGWRIERISQLGQELVYQVSILKISGLSIFPSRSCNRQQKQSVPFCFLQTPLFYRSPDSWLGHSFRILSTGHFINYVILYLFQLCTFFFLAFIPFFFREYLPIVLGKEAYGDLGNNVHKKKSWRPRKEFQAKKTKKIPKFQARRTQDMTQKLTLLCSTSLQQWHSGEEENSFKFDDGLMLCIDNIL